MEEDIKNIKRALYLLIEHLGDKILDCDDRIELQYLKIMLEEDKE